MPLDNEHWTKFQYTYQNAQLREFQQAGTQTLETGTHV